MVNNEMALTFSVRNNPGVYALLLGSGVSRESEVLTGWGILKDLIRQAAEVEGEDPTPDPIEWYRDFYDSEPAYDELLETIAPSPEERQAALNDYFEPTEEERERGVKTPSDAHKSIAWLVDESYINVIVTTNFDRLLRKAMNERGVTPTVISTPEEAKGASPLAHQEAVIIKVNGDYKKNNLKNTPEELSEYDENFRDILNTVFDEYGLIVCGWSGKWDDALREAILECESRRYSTYWAYHSELEEEAEEIVEHRDGIPIQIDGASEFFTELKENVQSLEGAEDGAPLTREIARERVKRYLTREERKIDLADLLVNEAERVRGQILDEERYLLDVKHDADTVEKRLNKYESLTETLLIASSTCAYWGPEVTNSATRELGTVIKRLGGLPSPDGRFKKPYRRLRLYPGAIMMHGTGVAAIESENWELLYEMMVETKFQDPNTTSAIISFHPAKLANTIPGRTWVSGTVKIKNRLKEKVRDNLRQFILDDDDYEEAFTRFEMISDLVLYDRVNAEMDDRWLFVPDRTYYDEQLDELRGEIEHEEEEWPPVQAGLFDGSVDRARSTIDSIKDS